MGQLPFGRGRVLGMYDASTRASMLLRVGLGSHAYLIARSTHAFRASNYLSSLLPAVATAAERLQARGRGGMCAWWAVES